MKTSAWAVVSSFTLAFLVLTAAPGWGQTYTWNGAGTDNFWSTGANWVGGFPPAEAGTGWSDAILQFGGTTRLNPVKDIPGDSGAFNVEKITFLSGAGSFNLTDPSGNGLDMLGTRSGSVTSDITNNSTNTQTIHILLKGRGGYTAGINFDTAAGDIDVTGVITSVESTGIHKNGGHILTLFNNNTYNGSTAINQGVVKITNAGALGNTVGGTTVANGAQLRLSGGLTFDAEPLTISGNGDPVSGSIIGRGALQSTGGANVWTGAITIPASGDAWINAASAPLTITGGVTGTNASLRLDLGTQTVQGNPLLLGSGGSLSVNSNSLLSVGGNTFGTLQVDWGGNFKMGATNVLPSDVTVLIGGSGSGTHGTLDLNGYSQTIGELADGGATPAHELVTNTSATAATLTINQSGGSTYDGIIAGNLGLTKERDGSLSLGGSNTFTGSTAINDGIVRVTNPTALGTTGAGTTVANYARLELYGGITVTGETVAIFGNGGGQGALQSAGGDNTWAGPVILNGGTDTRVGAASGTLTISGAIQDGTTNRIRVRNGAGTTIFSGANTYTGDTEIVTGTLKIGAADNRLPTSTTLIIGYPGITYGDPRFDLNGFNQEVAGLQVGTGNTSTHTVTNSSGTLSTLTVNNSSADYTYSGVLSGNLALQKKGTGTLTLGGDNTYTGTTTVADGTLLVDGTHTGAGTYTVQDGGTLGGTGTIDALIDVELGGTLAPGASVGQINLGELSMAEGSLLELEFNSLSNFDFVNVEGAAHLDCTLELIIGSGFSPGVGDTFDVLAAGDGITFTPGYGVESAELTSSGIRFHSEIVYDAGTGISTLRLQLVPEPATLLVWSLLAGLGVGLRWRRRTV